VCEKNVGDPILPSPTVVSVPRLMGGDPIRLKGYPLHMVHAEKIVTAVQRGVATRGGGISVTSGPCRVVAHCRVRTPKARSAGWRVTGAQT
jgi:hypothetical protein